MIPRLPKPVIVPDIIGDAVAVAQSLWRGSLGLSNTGIAEDDPIQIRYYHDGPEKIEANLLFKGQNAKYKYPAIILFHDFPEDLGVSSDYYANVTLSKLVLVAETDPNLLSEERYNKTFRPVLYPMYGWFKIALSRHPAIIETAPENIQARKWDRLYWGTQTAGKELQDYLDAIELQNLKLTIKQFC